MTDDIVTQPEQEIDFVEYLRLWASPDGNDQAVKDLHKAAEEIERLRADRDHWRNIAEQAVDNADQAVKLLEKLTGMSRD